MTTSTLLHPARYPGETRDDYKARRLAAKHLEFFRSLCAITVWF